jgi:hypothetical protein
MTWWLWNWLKFSTFMINNLYLNKKWIIKWSNDEKKTTKKCYFMFKIIHLYFHIIIIIIKIILNLTSFLRRFMRKSYWTLQRKIFNENKNFFLCARSRFDTALIKFMRRVIAWRSCHHHHLSLCLLNMWSHTARQIIRLTSSSTKIVLINSFSWIN